MTKLNGIKGVIAYVKDNPVLLLDLVKYGLAALIMFGLPISPELSATLTGVVLTALTIVTAGQVTPAAKADLAERIALYSPVPGEPMASTPATVAADSSPVDETRVLPVEPVALVDAPEPVAPMFAGDADATQILPAVQSDGHQLN